MNLFFPSLKLYPLNPIYFSRFQFQITFNMKIILNTKKIHSSLRGNKILNMNVDNIETLVDNIIAIKGENTIKASDDNSTIEALIDKIIAIKSNIIDLDERVTINDTILKLAVAMALIGYVLLLIIWNFSDMFIFSRDASWFFFDVGAQRIYITYGSLKLTGLALITIGMILILLIKNNKYLSINIKI